MGNCRDCKHFLAKIDDISWSPPPPRGFCGMAGSYGEGPEVPHTLAYATDWEDYHAELVVSPDFGCVQWEQKTG